MRASIHSRLWFIAVVAAAFILGAAVSAQPVLTQSAYANMLALGTETYSAFDANGTLFDAGVPGATANTYRIDMYAYGAEPSAVTEYAVPGPYPFDTLFPGATHVVVQNTGGTFNYYNYIKLEAGQAVYMGDASGDEATLFSLQAYDPPFPLYRFPLALGDSLRFTGNRRDHLGRPGRLDMQYKVESAGTLISRLGSESVLLVRRVFVYTDSTDQSGQPHIERRMWARFELVNPDGAVSYVNIDTNTVNDRTALATSVSHIILREPSPVPEIPQAVPGVAIHSIYPSPCPPGAAAQVLYSTGSSGPVTITLYDARGGERARVFEGYSEAGSHTVALPPAGLAPGVYFLSFRAGNAASVAPLPVLE